MDFNGDLVSDLPVLLAQQNEPFRRHVACALAKERGVSPKSHLYLADGTAMRDASRDAIWFGNTKQEALVTQMMISSVIPKGIITAWHNPRNP